MPSNPTLPEELKEACYTAIENIDWSRVEYDRPDGDEVLTAIAPLIIEWARKDQAEVDATLARSMSENEADGYYGQACYEVAAAIRAQFTDNERSPDDHQ